MPSIKLVAAVAAALLTSPSIGASGRPAGERPLAGERERPLAREQRPAGSHHARRRPTLGACHVSLEAPAQVTFGEPAGLSGHLACPPDVSPSGVEVRLFQRLAPALRGATLAAITTTETSGGFFFEATPSVSTTYFVEVASVASTRQTVAVAPAVALEGPKAAQLFSGRGGAQGTKRLPLSRRASRVTFTGTVRPAYVGELVVLQRKSSGGIDQWRRIGAGVVSAVVAGEGRFAIKHTFAAPGAANIRAVARPEFRHVAGASTTLSYVISAVQKPALTIEAAGGANPISAGESVTIQGRVKGGAGRLLTLRAHVAGARFAPVASTTVGEDGTYGLRQTPQGNTFYQVTDGVTKSAVMLEGVRYVITPEAVPTAAAQGAALSFTGRVAPAAGGHVIYLERQNASGSGYHVVESATLGPGGEYSISRAFETPGAVRLRVKLPGDPEGQGAATPPVSVTINPTPADLLAPQAPAHLPGDGQLSL
jgi:hypothetical protein